MDESMAAELEDSKIDNVSGLDSHIFPSTSLSGNIDSLLGKLLKAEIIRKANDKVEWIYNLDFLLTHDGKGTAENALIGLLNRLLEIVGVKSRIWSRMPGPDSKPGICLIQSGDALSWKAVLSTIQLQSSPTDKDSDHALVQLQNDAWQVFSSQHRRFFVGMTICGYEARLYIFDRSGLLGSDVYDIHTQNADRFIRVLSALMLSDSTRLGLDPTFSTCNGVSFVTVNNVRYKILDQRFKSLSIRGRGTCCWTVEREDRPGTKLIIKDSWVDESRRDTEIKIFGRIKGVEGVPSLIDYMFVENTTDNWHSTGAVRSIIDADLLPANIEKRKHFRAVTSPLAKDLTRFATKKELLLVLADAIRILVAIDEKGVLHRDISLGNIMIRNTEDSKPLALVIDYDYAIILEDLESLEPATGHRTGTLPFMAIDVMYGETHALRHDLESVFYVLMWICIHYNGPNHTRRRKDEYVDTEALKNWNNHALPLMTVADAKSGLFGMPAAFKKRTLLHVAPYFQELKPCLTDLQNIVFKDDDNVVGTKRAEEMIQVLKRHAEALAEEIPIGEQSNDDAGPVNALEEAVASVTIEDDAARNAPQTDVPAKKRIPNGRKKKERRLDGAPVSHRYSTRSKGSPA